MSNDGSVLIYSEHGEEFMPVWGSEEAAGLDVRTPCDIWLPPGAKTSIDTGLVVDTEPLTEKVFVLAVPRSSAGIKMDMMLQNTVGIIDPDYRGPEDEIKIFIKRDKQYSEIVDAWEIDREALVDEIKDDQEVLSDQVVQMQSRIWGMVEDRLGDKYGIEELQPQLDRKPDGTSVIYVHKMPESRMEGTDLLYEEGDRFCQLLFLPFKQPLVRQMSKEALNSRSSRGGFGSTGVK
jgi:dUTPase